MSSAICVTGHSRTENYECASGNQRSNPNRLKRIADTHQRPEEDDTSSQRNPFGKSPVLHRGFDGSTLGVSSVSKCSRHEMSSGGHSIPRTDPSLIEGCVFDSFHIGDFPIRSWRGRPWFLS